MIRVNYGGPPGGPFGWGVCNENLIRALAPLCDLRPVDWQRREKYSGWLFTPINNHDFTKLCRGDADLIAGYAFFEEQLSYEAVKNARLYDVIFVGSAWCRDRLMEHGIHSTVVVQGVDTSIFRPLEVPQWSRFTIFSGGKWEYRKGQDIVLAAFREYSKRYGAEIDLTCCWFNLWPDTMRSMERSEFIKYVHRPGVGGDPGVSRILADNGILASKVNVLPFINQGELAIAMNRCHVGLFPNRAEGGTNLILMEAMACGLPCIASYTTGHYDILTGTNSMWLEDPEDIEVIIGWIRFAMNAENNAHLASVAAHGVAGMRLLTWRRAATVIVERLKKAQGDS